MKESYIYKIDDHDRIQFVNSAWLRFAQENDAPELTESAIIGEQIWRFISGAETTTLYKSIFLRIRTEHVKFKIPFRCDSPTIIRFMELTLSSLPDNGIELSGNLLQNKKRKYNALFDATVSHSRKKLEICSLCRRVRKDKGEWLEPNEAMVKFKLFNNTHPPRLIESVCSLCNILLTNAFFDN